MPGVRRAAGFWQLLTARCSTPDKGGDDGHFSDDILDLRRCSARFDALLATSSPAHRYTQFCAPERSSATCYLRMTTPPGPILFSALLRFHKMCQSSHTKGLGELVAHRTSSRPLASNPPVDSIASARNQALSNPPVSCSVALLVLYYYTNRHCPPRVHRRSQGPAFLCSESADKKSVCRNVTAACVGCDCGGAEL